MVVYEGGYESGSEKSYSYVFPILYHFPIFLKQLYGQIICNCVLIFCSLSSTESL